MRTRAKSPFASFWKNPEKLPTLPWISAKTSAFIGLKRDLGLKVVSIKREGV